MREYRFKVKIKQTQLYFEIINSDSHESKGNEYQEGGFNNPMHIQPLTQLHIVTMQKGESEFGEHPFFQVGDYIDHIIVEIYSDNHEIMKSCSLNDCFVLKWEVNDAKGVGTVSIDQFVINCESISDYY